MGLTLLTRQVLQVWMHGEVLQHTNSFDNLVDTRRNAQKTAEIALQRFWTFYLMSDRAGATSPVATCWVEHQCLGFRIQDWQPLNTKASYKGCY